MWYAVMSCQLYPCSSLLGLCVCARTEPPPTFLSTSDFMSRSPQSHESKVTKGPGLQFVCTLRVHCTSGSEACIYGGLDLDLTQTLGYSGPHRLDHMSTTTTTTTAFFSWGFETLRSIATNIR